MPALTQTNPQPRLTIWPLTQRLAASPLVLSVVVVLPNALKPVVVDDAAYLAFARHIALHPFDPYGFDLYWYTRPQPAFEILCPPVLPYWLALGIMLFGENVPVLKLGMLPFVWLLAWGLSRLLRRLAPGTVGVMLPVLMLSPAVLPTVNLMLDIPAVSLSVAAVAVFLGADQLPALRRALLAGLLAGLAMQTKYTGLLVVPVLLLAGLLWARLAAAGVAVTLAWVLFGAWELYLLGCYGRSHFIDHLRQQADAADWAAWLTGKADLGLPLLTHLGCLGWGVGLLGWATAGVPLKLLVVLTVAGAAGFVMMIAVPGSLIEPLVLPLWTLAGVLVAVPFVVGSVGVVTRWWRRRHHRVPAAPRFLVLWLAVELVGYFVLTPFPAARRVIGLTIVAGLLVAWFWRLRFWRSHRLRGRPDPPGWLVAWGVASGLSVAALDTLDAFPEIVCAREAAQLARRAAPERVWYAGHWGFQYQCEREGMRPLVPGESLVRPADVIVLPIHPDDTGFHRPHIGRVPIRPPAAAVELIGVSEWDDVLSGRTIPNFYGGTVPITSRDHPRLRVHVYRARAAWRVAAGE